MRDVRKSWGLNLLRFVATPRGKVSDEIRPVFRATDIEGDEQDMFSAHLEAVAESTDRAVDAETVAMFVSRGLPLPARLQALADADHKYSF